MEEEIVERCSHTYQSCQKFLICVIYNTAALMSYMSFKKFCQSSMVREKKKETDHGYVLYSNSYRQLQIKLLE